MTHLAYLQPRSVMERWHRDIEVSAGNGALTKRRENARAAEIPRQPRVSARRGAYR
jgi:hypothetical protein